MHSCNRSSHTDWTQSSIVRLVYIKSTHTHTAEDATVELNDLLSVPRQCDHSTTIAGADGVVTVMTRWPAGGDQCDRQRLLLGVG